MISTAPEIVANTPLKTWFRVGGRADRLAIVRSEEELAWCVREDPAMCVLGEGANLLVRDEGIDALVVRFRGAWFERIEHESSSDMFVVGAAVSLMPLASRMASSGRAGLEGLACVPASIGGAVVMNAGGAFGQIADCVDRVSGIDREGRSVVLDRGEIEFGYRRSGLGGTDGIIVTSVRLRLPPGDPGLLRERLLRVVQAKKVSQPMSAQSAGCFFKNPILDRDIRDVGSFGDRVSAGMLIDRAGCKGLRVGGACVSERHANFIMTDENATADDVLRVAERCAESVFETFGIRLEREVVVWGRGTRDRGLGRAAS